MRGHSRSKNGVASLAYDPRIPVFFRLCIRTWMAGSSPAMTPWNDALSPSRRPGMTVKIPLFTSPPLGERERIVRAARADWIASLRSQ
jgi:hypothetical protein